MSPPLPFREVLEALRDGGPVDEETMRRVALAALRWVPAEQLIRELGRRWGLADTQCRLLLHDPQVEGEPHDLTPDEGWQR